MGIGEFDDTNGWLWRKIMCVLCSVLFCLNLVVFVSLYRFWVCVFVRWERPGILKEVRDTGMSMMIQWKLHYFWLKRLFSSLWNFHFSYLHVSQRHIPHIHTYILFPWSASLSLSLSLSFAPTLASSRLCCSISKWKSYSVSLTPMRLYFFYKPPIHNTDFQSWPWPFERFVQDSISGHWRSWSHDPTRFLSTTQTNTWSRTHGKSHW